MQLLPLLPGEIFAYALVFARLGTAMIVLPGFGEQFLPARVRLAVALVLTAAVAPLVRDRMPDMPAAMLHGLGLVGIEMAYGFFIGISARLILASLHIGGYVISFLSGLSYAQSVDPTQGGQGGLVSALLTLTGVLLLFVTGAHGIMLAAVKDSFEYFPPGSVPPVDSFTSTIVTLVSTAFAVGLQIAAPFIVYGLVFYIGLGLLQRINPQVQLFFIAIPLQMLFSMVILMVIFSAAMLWFLSSFESGFAQFLRVN